MKTPAKKTPCRIPIPLTRKGRSRRVAGLLIARVSIASTYAFVLHAEDTIDAGSDSDTRVIVWPAHHERTNVLRESLIRCPDSPYFSDAWYFADWAPQSGRALAKKLDRRHCRIVKWDDAKLRDGEPVFRGHALIDLDRGDV